MNEVTFIYLFFYLTSLLILWEFHNMGPNSAYLPIPLKPPPKQQSKQASKQK